MELKKINQNGSYIFRKQYYNNNDFKAIMFISLCYCLIPEGRSIVAYSIIPTFFRLFTEVRLPSFVIKVSKMNPCFSSFSSKDHFNPVVIDSYYISYF